MSITKRLLITFVVVVVGYYVAKLVGDIQMVMSYSTCGNLVLSAKPKWKNEEEARLVAYAIVDCVEKNNGFFAKLFFDKDELKRSFKYTKVGSGNRNLLSNTGHFIQGESMVGVITALILMALISALPVKLAADFTDGENTGLLTSFIASIAGIVLSFIVFRLINGGFMGFLMAYGALLAVYVYILRIPGRTIIGFSVIVFALQLAVIGALLSFGYNIGKLILP